MDLYFLDEKTPLLSESAAISHDKRIICVSSLFSKTKYQRETVDKDLGITNKFTETSCFIAKYCTCTCTCTVPIEHVHVCSTNVALCFLLIFVKIISTSMFLLIFQFYPVLVRDYDFFYFKYYLNDIFSK